MPKGKLTIIRLKNDDLDRIEKEYGYELSEEQWKSIVEATELMTWLVSALRSSALMAMVLKKLRLLGDAASSLRDELTDEPIHAYTKGNFETVYSQFFADTNGVPTFKLWSSFLVDLLEFTMAITRILGKEWGESGRPTSGFTPGKIWNIWVNSITSIVKSKNMPYKVRKDTDKRQGKISPFVRLIREIQNALPSEFRMFTQSDDALAQGINRARRDQSPTNDIYAVFDELMTCDYEGTSIYSEIGGDGEC